MDSVPSPHETAVLRKWIPRCRSRARKVWYPGRIAMGLDDIEEELLEAVLLACRRFPYYGGGTAVPTDAFVAAFVRRRQWNLCRKATGTKPVDTLTRAEEAGGGETEIADRDAPIPEEQLQDCDRQRVLQGLVYALRRNLPPAAFAALHLRYLEELSPSEIAQLAGLAPGADDRRVSARIESAKAVAAEFLRSLGVGNLEQLDAVSLEDFDASELDG